MKHKYYVKHNGVLYAPGTDVPEGKAPSKVESNDDNKPTDDVTNPEPLTEEGSNTELDNNGEEGSENDSEGNTEEGSNTENDVQYTRTQIQQMNNDTLRLTAEELGLEFDDNTTGKELKQLILGKLGI